MDLLLKSKNINLRKLKKTDAKFIFKYAKDPAIARFTNVPHPYTKKMSEDFVKMTHSNIKKKEAFAFGIELKETKEIIGMISLINLNLENKNAEIGYWLGKKHWGKKTMKEAIPLILNFGFKKLKLVRIQGIVLHPNIASAKLLEKSGFKYEGTKRKASFRKKKWYDEKIYSILKSEYKK
jgi:RimJ/RimL family protein N-acetyltransferase